MFSRLKADQWLGLLASLFACLLIFVWIPLDVDSGLTETIRRQVTLGDSLGPTVAGAVILIGGLLTYVRPDPQAAALSRLNLRWLGILLITITVSLVVMRFAGPIFADLAADKPYRALRATPPWNYIGFLAGGTLLVAILMSVIKGHASATAVLIGLAASLCVALLYDLPFDDLQLPPNGDV